MLSRISGLRWRINGVKSLASAHFLHTEASLRPRRCLMYMPGTSEKMMRKGAGLDVDVVCMDCEDAVALNAKDDARQLIRQVLGSQEFGRTEAAVGEPGIVIFHHHLNL